MIFVRKTLLGSSSLPEESASFSPPAPGSGSDNSRVPKSVTVAAELSLSSDSMDSVPVLPPPPSFKSVHFAVPGQEEEEEETVPDLLGIPTEGLPTRPATAKPDTKREEL